MDTNENYSNWRKARQLNLLPTKLLVYLVEDILIIAENGIKSLIGQYNITMYVNGFFDI